MESDSVCVRQSKESIRDGHLSDTQVYVTVPQPRLSHTRSPFVDRILAIIFPYLWSSNRTVFHCRAAAAAVDQNRSESN